MKLKPDEERMLRGEEGPAKKAAMEFLVQYGDALGAEEMIDVTNVHSLLQFMFYPDVLNEHLDYTDIDDTISKSVLNSDEKIVLDKVKTFTTTHIPAIDFNYKDILQCSKRGDPVNIVDMIDATKKYASRVGMTTINTCTPYTAGNLPVKGEHCAWTESSAIAFANSVLGVRTNIEGDHSSFCTAITGKTPKCGYHLDEERLGNVIVQVEAQPKCNMDWDLLGYYTGRETGLDVPVYNGITSKPELYDLMSLAASGITSGAISMFHVVGVTPEAPTLEAAVGNREIKKTIVYGEKERRETYEMLQNGHNTKMELVVLGCPHLPIEELNKIASMLEGKKCKAELMIFTHAQNKFLLEKDGRLAAFENAGAKVIIDSCPFNAKIDPNTVVCTNSSKMAHICAGMKGWQDVWYGTTEDCINAALSGEWKGAL